MICDECETVAHCLKNGCVPKQPSKDEALKLALEALEHIDYEDNDRDFLFPYQCTMLDNAITAIKQALNDATHLADTALDRMAENARELGLDYEPVQQSRSDVEPVGYLFQHEETGLTMVVDVQQVEWGFEKNNPRHQKIGPVYTTPPNVATPLAAQRQWVGLTDEEMYLNCPNWLSQEQCKVWIQQIEAKLKEKNSD
jgi:hypothetical protein